MHPAAQQAVIPNGSFQPSADTEPREHPTRAVSSALRPVRTLSNVDYVVAGISGVGGGSGTINVAGITGTVQRAFLYWHGINNSSSTAQYNNSVVSINGNAVTGTVMGDGPTNCWGTGSGRGYESEVTPYVSGNGSYAITGLSSSPGHNANGATLVVVYDDGVPANNHDLAFFVGNDANAPEGFPGETGGWNAALPVTYSGGPVKAILQVADGQAFTDRPTTFNAGADVIIPDSATRWDGLSLPTAGTSRASNGELWDIHTFDISAAFGSPGPKTLTISGMANPGVGEDCLSLTTVLIELNPAPAMTINNVFIAEGDGGTRTASFTVTRTVASAWPATVNFTTADGTAIGTAATLSNTAAIDIPTTAGTASLYPSTVTVPAGMGTITKVTARLNNFSHTYPNDVDVLLVGPGGQKVMLMSDAGSSADASDLTFTFDDAAASGLSTTTLSSGTFKPTNVNTANDTLPAPAPAGPHGTALSVFNGTSPTGDWRLFVADHFSGDGGSVLGGWTLILTAPTATSDYVSTSGVLTLASGVATGSIDVTINGDVVPEPTETFTVALSNAVGATIADGQGLGAITNDEFTDASLAGLFVQSVHLTELRTLVNELRVLHSLSAASFTDPALPSGVILVKAVHVSELRTALAAVYTAAGASPPSFTDPGLIPGVTPIKAIHITELREKAANAP